MWSVALYCAFILLRLVGLSIQATSADDAYYTAGVVEFQPAAINQPSIDQLNDNLRGYLEILLSPEASETDIIVFPESTLNKLFQKTFVPDPENRIIPCNDSKYEPFLQEISCAAASIQKYVIINVSEKEICTNETQSKKNDTRPCSQNGLSSFNTNVVFDRKGMVISRYRKFNVYGEPHNVTYMPELVTFKTDFGVEFGLFTCFDIHFYSPAMDLVHKGVKDMIFNSFWYSELPFLTAVQIQQSWAYANDVNLLAAGASYPSIGTTGSGIYSAKQGALISVMATEPQRKLYVANVTKSTHWNLLKPTESKEVRELTRRSLDGLALMREYKLNEYTSQLLEVDEYGEAENELCHEFFCCNFNINIRKLTVSKDSVSYQYRIAAFDGDRQYSGNGYTKYKLCAIFACKNNTQNSCGSIFDDSVLVKPAFAFKSISIEVTFPKAEKLLIMPNSVDQNLSPLTVDRFNFTIEDKIDNFQVKKMLIKEADDLLTFGIYANYYEGSSSMSAYSISLPIIIFGAVFALLVARLQYP